MNCPRPATVSASAYALMALIDRKIACNEGLIESIDVVTEPGSFLDPVFPAPVAARTHTCQRIIDVIHGALASALPAAATAASNGANTTAFVSGLRPGSATHFLYFETYGGGSGARSMKDGKDAVQCHITNTANTPVEIIETEFPLIVEDYGLVPDTGGAGKFRGGLALRRTMRPRENASFTGAGERFSNAPWGLFGGKAGAPGSFRLADDDGTIIDLPPKPAPMRVSPRQRIIVQSPGAGGYGDPATREPRLISRDWRSGKFSADYLLKYYGLSKEELEKVPFDPDQLDYDEA
jgi:N-methylhydantoinase B